MSSIPAVHQGLNQWRIDHPAGDELPSEGRQQRRDVVRACCAEQSAPEQTRGVAGASAQWPLGTSLDLNANGALDADEGLGDADADGILDRDEVYTP